MSIAALIRSMADAGATPEAIALAVEAIEAVQAVAAESRAKDAARTRRYRERGGGAIPEDMRAEVMARDGYSCVECSATERLECDHIHPVSKGGPTTTENLQVLCRACNARKKDRIRKRTARGMSEDSSGHSEQPLSPSFLPPTPPNQTTPIRGVSSRVRARGGDPGGFAQFWAIYPNRAARKHAVTAFAKAINAEALETILAGVRRALPGWEGAETRFIPHAASWLNAERWNDPPPAPRNGTRDDRQPPRTAKSDHLDAVARAMVAACDRPEGECGGHSPEPGLEGGGGGFASAA